MRKLNLYDEIDKTTKFIKRICKESGLNTIVIGLSGGIDSSVVATLCVKALGKENVKGVMLPYKTSHPDSLNDAKKVAEFLGINYEIIDISPMVDAYFEQYKKDASALRKGNLKARERMCVLYDLSAQYFGLVVGTGNKSELMVGYMTQYGDGASAFEPIGHLYKTEVFEIAEILNLPQEIITKKPTADLWQGQTDEEELGITYSNLDKILNEIIDNKKAKQEILEMGFLENDVDNVISLIKRSAFKRIMPPVLEEVWG